MKRSMVMFVLVLGLALGASGCLKKSSETNASVAAGLEPSAEDLAQLPQTTAAQQSSIEVLPIETSPVTQAVSAPASLPASTGTESLGRDMQIQTALKSAGFYTGNIDGKIGPASKRAIEAFQQQNGLKVDGKVGPKTWAALQPYLSGQTVSTETTTAGN